MRPRPLAAPIMPRLPFLVLVCLSALLTNQAFALTVATYNTKYLSRRLENPCTAS